MLQGIFMPILGGVKLSYRILSEPCPKPYCFSSLLSKVSYATKLMGSNYKSSMYRYHFLSWSFHEKQLLLNTDILTPRYYHLLCYFNFQY